jgi:hypothetical protein
MPRRYDAELIKTSKYREIEYLLMRTRAESINYYDKRVDLTKTFKFLEEYNKGKKKEDQMTFFHIFLATSVRTITLRPKINRFVQGYRLWQRNQIALSFVVKKDNSSAGETVARIFFDPFDDLESVRKKVQSRLYETRHGKDNVEKDVNLFGKLPRFLIRFIFWLGIWTEKRNMPIKALVGKLPMFCSFFIANLGSIGIDAVYHHLYEVGNAGVFLAYGPFYKGTFVDQETKEIQVKDCIDLRVTIDDRFAGGAYTGPTVHLLESLMADPERLMKPPELTDEQLDKLMLKKYKKERLTREKQRKKEAKEQNKKKKN